MFWYWPFFSSSKRNFILIHSDISQTININQTGHDGKCQYLVLKNIELLGSNFGNEIAKMDQMFIILCINRRIFYILFSVRLCHYSSDQKIVYTMELSKISITYSWRVCVHIYFVLLCNDCVSFSIFRCCCLIFFYDIERPSFFAITLYYLDIIYCLQINCIKYLYLISIVKTTCMFVCLTLCMFNVVKIFNGF